MLDRYSFEILAYVESEGDRAYPWRELVDKLAISGSRVTQTRKALLEAGLLEGEGDRLHITPAGLLALEPYRVRRAVIFAAGFGSRMVPVTLHTPKPLVKVGGIRIIDRLLDALLAQGIDDIVIVRGYLKECFDELLEKYPMLTFVDNDLYDRENNISSALAAGEKINGCYICAGDLLVTNPRIIRKYHYCSNYLASFALETDDWCFDFRNGLAENYRKGGTNCFNQYEITYWTPEDCEKLRRDWALAYRTEGGRDLFWEFIPLVLCRDRYQVEIRQCRKEDIMEIDNYYELAELDPSYREEEAK